MPNEINRSQGEIVKNNDVQAPEKLEFRQPAEATNAAAWVSPRVSKKFPKKNAYRNASPGIPASTILYGSATNAAYRGKRNLGIQEEIVKEPATKIAEKWNPSGQGVDKSESTCTRKKKESDSMAQERVEEFAFAKLEMHVQGHLLSDSAKAEKMIKRSSSQLRMKLWEVLGTSSQNPEACSPSFKDNTKNLDEDMIATKRRINSDTIETYSQSSNPPIGRPVTRSITQKKDKHKGQEKIRKEANSTRSSPSSLNPFNPRKRNIFPCLEMKGKAGIYSWDTGHSPLIQEEKNIQTTPSFINLGDFDFSEVQTQRKDIGPTESKKFPHAFEKSIPWSCVNKKTSGIAIDMNATPREECQEKAKISHSPFRNTHIPEKKSGPIRDFVIPLMSNIDYECNSQSPTLARHTIGSTESPAISPAERTPRKSLSSFQECFQAQTFSNSGSLASLPENKANDHDVPSGLLHDVVNRETSSQMSSQQRGKDKEQKVSTSLTLDKDGSEHFENDVKLSNGKWLAGGSSPSLSDIARDIKRTCSFDDIFLPKINADLSTLSGDSGRSQEMQAHLQEDGLISRDVQQFVLILEKFKAKMEFQARRKSSEFLLSLAGKIQVQLKKVESQIQTDMEKLSNISMSKRRRMESKFVEHQERLHLIHEKFKEDVNRHLEDCRHMLKELEAYQMKTMTAIERKKSSHTKLIAQLEALIGEQLADAERTIEDIQKESKRKMSGLKLVLKECLTENMFA